MLHGPGATESSLAGEASAGIDAARAIQMMAGGVDADVATEQNGCLPGRVIAGPMSAGSAGGEAFQPSPALRVRLVCGQRTVAIAAADSGGRFAFQNLPPGYYGVVVEGPGVPPNQFACRVWPASSAPPRAARELDLPIAAILPGTANACRPKQHGWSALGRTRAAPVSVSDHESETGRDDQRHRGRSDCRADHLPQRPAGQQSPGQPLRGKS